MHAVLTPPLAHLVNLGKEAVFGEFHKEKLLEALTESELFVADFEALYLFLSPTLYSDEESAEIRKYLASTLMKLKDALKDLRKTVERERTFEFNPVLSKLEDAAGKLVGAARELKEMEKKEPVESPLPLVNTAIKVGFNVANGSEPKEALIPFIPALVELVDTLEHEVSRFEALHPDEVKTAATARKLVNDMKEGIGACASYVKEPMPHYLADGLRLLRYPSRNLYMVLRAMDRVARWKADFSTIPALDEFDRAYRGWKEGALEWEVVSRSLGSLEFLASLYGGLHTAVRRFPFFYVLSNLWSAAQVTRLQFESFFAGFRKEVEAKSQSLDLETLKMHLEGYSRMIGQLITKMEQEIEKVADAPYMEELKELIGRLLSGGLVLEYFAARVQALAQSHQVVLEEFKAARSHAGSPPEVREVYDLLRRQGEGIREILQYLDDSVETHLHDGLAMIEKALPRLAETQKSVRVAIVETVSQNRGVKPICVRCGRENLPGARSCRACSALLPFIVDEKAGSDMVDESEGTPLNIARIEEAVRRFEAGTLSGPALSGEIKSYLNRLEGIRSDFAARSREIMKNSAQADTREWASSFERCLDSMREGLEMMLMFAGSPELLYRGMQGFSAAASEMASLRQSVRAAR